MMNDYSRYLLRTDKSLPEFRERYNSILKKLMHDISSFLDKLPDHRWVNYLSGVPERNIPVIIGALCCWIDLYQDIYDQVDFNPSATQIRRRKYEEFKSKPQNNGGDSSHKG